MADYLDFFNVYVMGGVELLFQFCFLARILKRKVRLPFLFLFAVWPSSPRLPHMP